MTADPITMALMQADKAKAAGNEAQAVQILSQALQAAPTNVDLLVALIVITPNDIQRRFYAKQLQQIEPNHPVIISATQSKEVTKMRLCSTCQYWNPASSWNCQECGNTLAIDSLREVSIDELRQAKHVSAVSTSKDSAVKVHQSRSGQPPPRSSPNLTQNIPGPLARYARPESILRWEYLHVECLSLLDQGYVVWTINHELVSAPILLANCMTYLGQQGWECIAATEGKMNFVEKITTASLIVLFRHEI